MLTRTILESSLLPISARGLPTPQLVGTSPGTPRPSGCLHKDPVPPSNEQVLAVGPPAPPASCSGTCPPPPPAASCLHTRQHLTANWVRASPDCKCTNSSQYCYNTMDMQFTLGVTLEQISLVIREESASEPHRKSLT